MCADARMVYTYMKRVLSTTPVKRQNALKLC